MGPLFIILLYYIYIVYIYSIYIVYIQAYIYLYTLVYLGCVAKHCTKCSDLIVIAPCSKSY